jgi:hypothetical protein
VSTLIRLYNGNIGLKEVEVFFVIIIALILLAIITIIWFKIIQKLNNSIKSFNIILLALLMFTPVLLFYMLFKIISNDDLLLVTDKVAIVLSLFLDIYSITFITWKNGFK